LVVLLVKIAADGVLEYDELQILADWLNAHNHLDVPAVKYLIELMLRMCQDGELRKQEIFELQLAIERVLPKQFRERVTEARKAIHYDQPASQAQLDLIEQVTKSRPTGLSRRQASEILDGVFSSATNRQIMFLRFWGRLDLVSRARQEISDWMDEFTAADPARWSAWSLFKAESGDDGSQRDPSWVPVGVGSQYLRRVSR
jgi:hypothetical protein